MSEQFRRSQEFEPVKPQPTEVVLFERSNGMKPNQERHNKNLHGEKGVQGYTGFYHDKFYWRGVHKPSKKA